MSSWGGFAITIVPLHGNYIVKVTQAYSTNVKGYNVISPAHASPVEKYPLTQAQLGEPE